MKNKYFKAWKCARKGGFIKFIFVNGILCFGLPMSLIMELIEKLFYETVPSISIVTNFTQWLLAGLVYAAIFWYVSELKYKKEMNRRDNRA